MEQSGCKQGGDVEDPWRDGAETATRSAPGDQIISQRQGHGVGGARTMQNDQKGRRGREMKGCCAAAGGAPRRADGGGA